MSFNRLCHLQQHWQSIPLSGIYKPLVDDCKLNKNCSDINSTNLQKKSSCGIPVFNNQSQIMDVYRGTGCSPGAMFHLLNSQDNTKSSASISAIHQAASLSAEAHAVSKNLASPTVPFTTLPVAQPIAYDEFGNEVGLWIPNSSHNELNSHSKIKNFPSEERQRFFNIIHSIKKGVPLNKLFNTKAKRKSKSLNNNWLKRLYDLYSSVAGPPKFKEYKFPICGKFPIAKVPVKRNSNFLTPKQISSKHPQKLVKKSEKADNCLQHSEHNAAYVAKKNVYCSHSPNALPFISDSNTNLHHRTNDHSAQSLKYKKISHQKQKSFIQGGVKISSKNKKKNVRRKSGQKCLFGTNISHNQNFIKPGIRKDPKSDKLIKFQPCPNKAFTKNNDLNSSRDQSQMAIQEILGNIYTSRRCNGSKELQKHSIKNIYAKIQPKNITHHNRILEPLHNKPKFCDPFRRRALNISATSKKHKKSKPIKPKLKKFEKFNIFPKKLENPKCESSLRHNLEIKHVEHTIEAPAVSRNSSNVTITGKENKKPNNQTKNVKMIEGYNIESNKTENIQPERSSHNQLILKSITGTIQVLSTHREDTQLKQKLNKIPLRMSIVAKTKQKNYKRTNSVKYSRKSTPSVLKKITRGYTVEKKAHKKLESNATLPYKTSKEELQNDDTTNFGDLKIQTAPIKPENFVQNMNYTNMINRKKYLEKSEQENPYFTLPHNISYFLVIRQPKLYYGPPKSPSCLERERIQELENQLSSESNSSEKLNIPIKPLKRNISVSDDINLDNEIIELFRNENASLLDRFAGNPTKTHKKIFKGDEEKIQNFNTNTENVIEKNINTEYLKKQQNVQKHKAKRRSSKKFKSYAKNDVETEEKNISNNLINIPNDQYILNRKISADSSYAFEQNYENIIYNSNGNLEDYESNMQDSRSEIKLFKLISGTKDIINTNNNRKKYDANNVLTLDEFKYQPFSFDKRTQLQGKMADLFLKSPEASPIDSQIYTDNENKTISYMPVLYHEPFHPKKPWTYIGRYPTQPRPAVDECFRYGKIDRYRQGVFGSDLSIMKLSKSRSKTKNTQSKIYLTQKISKKELPNLSSETVRNKKAALFNQDYELPNYGTILPSNITRVSYGYGLRKNGSRCSYGYPQKKKIDFLNNSKTRESDGYATFNSLPLDMRNAIMKSTEKRNTFINFRGPDSKFYGINLIPFKENHTTRTSENLYKDIGSIDSIQQLRTSACRPKPLNRISVPFIGMQLRKKTIV